MTFEYPAVFTPNEFGCIVRFPDLEECFASDPDFASALKSAKFCIQFFLNQLDQKDQPYPLSTQIDLIPHGSERFTALIRVRL